MAEAPTERSARRRTGPTRIYLDQAKWIELARAAKGIGGEEDDSALSYLREGVSAGELVCPVGLVHVWETNQRGRRASRQDVVDLMLELSGGASLWSWDTAMMTEIEWSVRRFTGLPQIEPPWLSALGAGRGHLEPVVARDEEGNQVPVPDKAKSYLESEESLRARLMLGPQEVHNHRPFEAHTVEEIEEIRARARAAGVTKERLRDDNLEQLFEFWKNGLLAVVERLGCWTPLEKHGVAPGEPSYFRSLPLVDAAATLTAWRDGEWDRRIEPNDLRDARWSDVAFAYCDVIVGEKFLIGCAQRSGLDQRCGVSCSRHLRDLPTLVGAVRRT